MTRKAFVADLAAASAQQYKYVKEVVRGKDDGEVNFLCIPADGGIEPMQLTILAMDVPGYPHDNTFMVFTGSALPPAALKIIEDMSAVSTGMRIAEIITTIADKLYNSLASSARNSPLRADSDVDMEDKDECALSDDDDASDQGFPSDWSDDNDIWNEGAMAGAEHKPSERLSEEAFLSQKRRIQQDFISVRTAGFKVGILSGMSPDSMNSMVSISIHVSKLGLSTEAMQAWDLEQEHYVVLVLRYTAGYKTFEQIIDGPANSDGVKYRIGTCKKYKPTYKKALAAFSGTKGEETSPNTAGNKSSTVESDAGLMSLFIGSSLDALLANEFVSMLKIRHRMTLGWEAAKKFVDERQGRSMEDETESSLQYDVESVPQSSLPDIVAADHLRDDRRDQAISFPLLAVQFALRYLVRCTEYCLICHSRVSDEFEALKPYVCENPLCLYQYMSLGFGPSIEHEVLTQPYVVDLLVSLCYASANAERLREYPTGMSLSVPNPALFFKLPPLVSGQTEVVRQSLSNMTSQEQAVPVPRPAPLIARFDAHRHELIFDAPVTSSPVRAGDWVIIHFPSLASPSLHYRVEDALYFPTVKLSDTPVCKKLRSTGNGGFPTPATTPPPPALVLCQVDIYNINFDKMPDVEKSATIAVLLDTLPPVKEMCRYLNGQSMIRQASLESWKERISPAALGILRWIIASNRSCILQVDRCPGQTREQVIKSKVRTDQKVANIGSHWIQFRFAQGSPDKEQRFLAALKAEEDNLDPDHPTIFAFHGSPVYNWHSIIRHGLNFKDTAHGRAYGHGVYHAKNMQVSVGYAGRGHPLMWPNSELKIDSVMSINEIVGCPSKFVSKDPYIVVQHIDWIQCRYLLVSTNVSNDGTIPCDERVPYDENNIIKQLPAHTSVSEVNTPIGIPLCASSVSKALRRGDESSSSRKPSKKLKIGTVKALGEAAPISDDEDIEDIQFLILQDQAAAEGDGACRGGLAFKRVTRETEFVPKSLDQSTLPMLREPSYASVTATLRLNRDLKALLKLQASQPLHELGWYINEEVISNVYQWIVELHSFDADIPLAKDMKAAGVNSVVLEMRFGKDYPHTPPFVRVIRPQFLPFMHGGGGHVVIGGALCMELLTNNGWSAALSIESVLLQIRLAICEEDPPARLLTSGAVQQYQLDYGREEGVVGFLRACKSHGWEVPKDFMTQFTTN